MHAPKPIPFTRVTIAGKESAYLNEVLESRHIQGDGPMTKHCEELLEKITGSGRALLTTSGTDALELATLLADIGPGDEVIMPSFTFVSTANAVVLRGATPVFVDIRPDTLNIDEKLIEDAVTSKTKAIMPVHYAGISCDMDVISEISARRKIIVIEDAAHAAGAYWKGKHLGSIGALGMLSFHQTKNISAGEGGALLINDPKLMEMAEIQREKGTNRRKFLRGEIDKYTWVNVGSSFLPGELTAAVLRAQLEEIKSLNDRRIHIFDRYMKEFASLAKSGKIGLPSIPEGARPNGHKFYIMLNSAEQRPILRDYLAERGIQAVSHYEPLHLAPAARQFARTHGNLIHTTSCAARILRLPLYSELDSKDQDRVIEAVFEFFK